MAPAYCRLVSSSPWPMVLLKLAWQIQHSYVFSSWTVPIWTFKLLFAKNWDGPRTTKLDGHMVHRYFFPPWIDLIWAFIWPFWQNLDGEFQYGFSEHLCSQTWLDKMCKHNAFFPHGKFQDVFPNYLSCKTWMSRWYIDGFFLHVQIWYALLNRFWDQIWLYKRNIGVSFLHEQF